ncbi:MAG: hypothetical protein PWQ82_979 [Thermosediminibacterales bacterium]|nr:hypothetical protein [Thermosediminibacterales bacterium]MDK2835833.1 hypothetical protein [Thermosediminibacterales bacterium]
MLNINAKLNELENKGKKIQIGLVGAGQMGTGMVGQMALMKGLKTAILCDINLENARNAFVESGVDPAEIIEANTVESAQNAWERGKYIITSDHEIVTKMGQVDVVIDATGIPEVGARIAVDSIYNGKHVVMLNVEADITVGPLLKKMADSAGVVYTGSAGDEPGAIKELYDFADGLGFEVVACGKGKNNPLDYEANPSTVQETAIKKGVNPKMLTSFVDGTKTMVEMTCVANAVGFVPDKTGMHGPSCNVEDLPKIFSLKEQGGILSKKKVVDFVNGVAPGVFVIVTTELEVIRKELEYVSMGKGPNYVFYRPYHLTSIETPLSAARAYIYKEATIAPLPRTPHAETVAVAKIDLKKGELLDGIGGYTVYGTIDTYESALLKNALPLGLVNKNVKLKTDVRKGEIITYDMVELDENSFILQLRRLQDRLFAK